MDVPAGAGILEQGSRLQEVVSQLQAALHPSAATTAVPPALQQASSNGAGQGQVPGAARRQALPGTSLNGDSGASSSSGSGGGLPSSGQWQLAESPSRPALPSSSIGSDYQLGSTIDLSVDEPAAAAGDMQSPGSGQGGSSSTSSGGGGGGGPISGNGNSPGMVDTSSTSSSNGSDGDGGSSGEGSGTTLVYGSRASADLLNVLMPLLASASNFAAVSGVNFVMAHNSGRPSSSSSSGSGSGAGPAANGPAPQQQEPAQAQALALPAAEVAVGPGKLKRMLSQLIDGLIACAARGDLVQASVHPQQWQGRPGVTVSLCCCYSLLHGGGGSSGASLPRPPLQPEFAFLQGTASEAGGWFEVHADATPDIAHLNSSALTATLWLPTVPPS